MELMSLLYLRGRGKEKVNQSVKEQEHLSTEQVTLILREVSYQEMRRNKLQLKCFLKKLVLSFCLNLNQIKINCDLLTDTAVLLPLPVNRQHVHVPKRFRWFGEFLLFYERVNTSFPRSHLKGEICDG